MLEKEIPAQGNVKVCIPDMRSLYYTDYPKVLLFHEIAQLCRAQIILSVG